MITHFQASVAHAERPPEGSTSIVPAMAIAGA
jgi:hypothetical protein